MHDGPTYAEARMWFRWLQVFTPHDLADAMAVHPDVAYRFVRAAEWHGIVENTGDRVNGTGPEEDIYSYVPLPPGPTEHPTGPLPELMAVREMGGFLLFDQRGLPVRLVDNTERRNMMQTTGGARVRMKLRDARYRATEQAKVERAEKDRQRRIRKQQEGKKPWE